MPLTGVAEAGEVSEAYFSDPILLFFGTFILAAAVEKHGLHKLVGRNRYLCVAFVFLEAISFGRL
jgi:di/tricarboxylate transporter